MTTDWQVIHENLVAIAERRCALDVEEAKWLRAAEDCMIWRELGMVSPMDYLERTLGYTPHAANERLRVAREVGALPAIEKAWAEGELFFSAVREITRVAIEDTDAVWCQAARGKTVREIEDLVAGKKKGDLPDDPSDPSAIKQRVTWELSPEVAARLHQTCAALGDGKRLDHDALVTAFCDAALGAATTGDRAKWQIAVTVCSSCERGWQDGGGRSTAIDDAAIERAECDAVHIGSIDGDKPARAAQDISPAVRRFVLHRDHERCRVTGCRSARSLELHHIVHRAHGGAHDASNIISTCGSCHAAIHRGALAVSGTAGKLVVTRPNDPVASHVGLRRKVKRALVDLGYAPEIAATAAGSVCDQAPADAPFDQLLEAAERQADGA